jgi:glycosyltransferase involved in cell wall biosynthesis
MSTGLPCIVSNAGGLPESVQDGVNGFVVDHQNMTSYVNAIFKLINNSGLRRKMGNRGKKIFEQKFSYEHWKKEMDMLHKL